MKLLIFRTTRYRDAKLTIRHRIDNSAGHAILQRMDVSVAYRRRDLPGHADVSLALHCWGDPVATPLLFLHGFGQTAKAWESSARSLARQGHYCVALDARGHGDSGWFDGPRYEIPHFEADVRRVVDTFKQQPGLIGASMGGLLGMTCEADSPGLFELMVLVDITPRWEEKGVDRILEFMAAKPDGFADLEEAAATVATYLPHRARGGPETFNGLRKNLRLSTDGRYRWHWDPKLLNGVEDFKQEQMPRLLAAAPKLGLPVCLVSGGRSDVTSDQTIDEFIQLVPHAEHVRIGAARHMVAGDQNDEFSAAVIQFINAYQAANQTSKSTETLNGEIPWQQSA